MTVIIRTWGLSGKSVLCHNPECGKTTGGKTAQEPQWVRSIARSKISFFCFLALFLFGKGFMI